jgi:hypothetical protein
MDVKASFHRIKKAAVREEQAYGRERPLTGYLGSVGSYGLYCAVLVGIGKSKGRRLPEHFMLRDVALCSVATFRLSRMIAKSNIASPLRFPFTEYQEAGAPAEANEEARGQGVRKTIGELITCPFCLSVWCATSFIAGLVLFPRQTRLSASVFAALAGADALQLAYGMLGEKEAEG